MTNKENNEIAINQMYADVLKGQIRHLHNIIVVIIICWMLTILGGIGGFMWYESQYETVVTTTTTTTEDTSMNAEGEHANINKVDGNQYNDSSNDHSGK